jgi:hypothetical protein
MIPLDTNVVSKLIRRAPALIRRSNMTDHRRMSARGSFGTISRVDLCLIPITSLVFAKLGFCRAALATVAGSAGLGPNRARSGPP